jgi:replicative DNA helicase
MSSPRIPADTKRKAIALQRHAVDPTDEPDPFIGGQVGINVLDSEGVFLSHCLMHPEQAGALVSMLRPEHFYATANQRVFEAYAALWAEQPDVVTVVNWMRAHGTLAQVGGTPYLSTLVDCTPATVNPALHAEQIREAWRQRELMACLARVAIRLRGGDLSHKEARRVLSEHFKESGQ